jgi:predicted dehydrogenase
MADQVKKDIGRRSFLKTSTVIGAGLALAPHILNGEEAAAPAGQKNDEINVAIIGCGQQGQVLMNSVMKDCMPGVRFKAVCDISPHNAKYMCNLLTKVHKHDVTDHVYENYKEMLDKEKDLQAVICATPDWYHHEHAIAAMKAGLHCYCEKEMSNDLEKARQMVKTSQETKKLLQIGHQRRSHPRYLFAYEKLMKEAKVLGNVTQAYAQWNRGTANSRPIGINPKAAPPAEVLEKYGYASLPEYLNWRWYRKYGGGPICDLGAHQIDVFGWFLDAKPKNIIVSGGCDYWSKQKDCTYQWYDNVRAIYEFATPDGPVRALYQVLTTTSALGYFEAFMGTDGTLNISEAPSRVRLFAEGFLQADAAGEHPWAKWEKKGYIKKPDAPPPVAPAADAAGGMADVLKIYKASLPPVQYMFNQTTDTTYHGPHLKNFFDSVRGKAKLNCSGEIAFESAVQVLKCNQLLDAKQASAAFEEKDFIA